MEKVVLVRYSEIFLKGKNFAFFENKLHDNIKEKLNNLTLGKIKFINEYLDYIEEKA